MSPSTIHHRDEIRAAVLAELRRGHHHRDDLYDAVDRSLGGVSHAAFDVAVWGLEHDERIAASVDGTWSLRD